MLKFPGTVCFHQLSKREKVYSWPVFRSCLHLPEWAQAPPVIYGLLSLHCSPCDRQRLLFLDIIVVRFSFPVANNANASKHSTQSSHRAHGPTRVLPGSREGADADATELQLTRTQQGRHSSQDELERGRGAMAFSPVATERMTEKSPVCPPEILSGRHRKQREANASSFTHPPTVRVCVQTHSRASLFHRKNTCHLYQMAMDFQHKQYFHNTIVIITYFSARGTPLNKGKDSC